MYIYEIIFNLRYKLKCQNEDRQMVALFMVSFLKDADGMENF